MPLLQVPAFYAERNRASVLEQGNAGEEFYLLPACALANRLLATAKAAAASTPDTAPIPTEVPSDSMLIAIVHRKVCPPSCLPLMSPMPALDVCICFVTS